MQKLLITIVLIAAAAQVAYAQPKPKKAQEIKTALAPCSVTGATTDLLMSDEIAKYLLNEGRDQVLGEEDME
ncbi:MAG TPA: hypothetical protein VIF37_20510 [Methylobacter sp.]|jgi:hypothetical protein